MKNSDILQTVKENKDILSIHTIEKILAMPEGTLLKAVNGSRSLPTKWRSPLENFIISRFYKN
tara:strand:+ start:26607 stop:26795 length:189 start_codon:yes stop_codon:yes gene_type:complete